MNKINQMQIKINESASDIDIQLQKRYDTLKKVSAIESQIKFDKETLENIAALCSGYSKANTIKKDEILSKISSGLTMTFEQYPKLGADWQYYTNDVWSYNDWKRNSRSKKTL